MIELNSRSDAHLHLEILQHLHRSVTVLTDGPFPLKCRAHGPAADRLQVNLVTGCDHEIVRAFHVCDTLSNSIDCPFIVVGHLKV
jgi:hypothetical protein